MIFNNHISRVLNRGQHTKGYILKVREDGKLDISLDKPGYQKIEPASEILLQFIQENNGKLFLTDKSDPDEIREIVGMSKKTFKQAVGNLYKQKYIIINEDSIEMIV